MTKQAQLERINQVLRDQRLVVLAGAGISMGSPTSLPSWTQLVSRMAEHAANYSEARATAIREQMSSSLIDAIELYEIGDCVPPVERAKFLRNQFDITEGATTAVARELSRLGVPLYLTTNYDNALKNALKNRDFEVLSNSDSELSAAISLLGDKPMLVHLHGRAVAPESMVLGRRSYESLTTRPSYKHLLRDVFVGYSVLAVGFSFADPPFQSLLRYIADELGSAGRSPHLAIIGNSATVDAELLRRANFELLRYDDSTNHEEVHRILAQLPSYRPTSLPPASRPGSALSRRADTTLELARIYTSLTGSHKGQALDLAAASLVVHGITNRPQRSDALAARLARRMALPQAVAATLVERGALVLRQSGVLDEANGLLRLAAPTPAAPPPGGVVDALTHRLAALDKRLGRLSKVHLAALDVVKRVMLVQGMTAARAFVEADPPDAYLLDRVVRDAIELAKVAPEHRQLIQEAVTQILRAPSPEVSRELFELAHAAFALETVFLNPADVDLGKVLTWQLYIDSNILVRLLHPACDSTRTFQPLLERLQRLRIPLTIIRPFLDEVIAHANLVEQQTGKMTIEAVNAFLRDTPVREQSPLLRWFSFSATTGQGPNNFPRFRRLHGLMDVQSLVPVVERLGIATDCSDAIRTYDTSDRETLWHDLREFRTRDQSSQGARRLRRAEATQVLWLAHLREAGTRAWFLSQDGQLRRALKYIQGGRYAGYVTTPASWMMKLSELHWGNLDVAGFSELMWVIPLSKPTERLRAAVAAEVLKQAPDLAGRHPEWLRDRIEDVLSRSEQFIAADLSSDDDPVEGLKNWEKQVVPPAVDTILDQLGLTEPELDIQQPASLTRKKTHLARQTGTHTKGRRPGGGLQKKRGP